MSTSQRLLLLKEILCYLHMREGILEYLGKGNGYRNRTPLTSCPQIDAPALFSHVTRTMALRNIAPPVEKVAFQEHILTDAIDIGWTLSSHEYYEWAILDNPWQKSKQQQDREMVWVKNRETDQWVRYSSKKYWGQEYLAVVPWLHTIGEDGRQRAIDYPHALRESGHLTIA